MTTRSFAETALRLWSVYWLVSAIEALANVASYGMGKAEGAPNVSLNEWIVVSTITIGVDLALGVSLLVYARPLAEKLAAKDGISESVPATLPLQSVAFSVLGAYLAATALTYFGHHLYNFYLFERTTTSWEVRTFIKREWAALLGTLVRLLVGVALFFGGKSLSRFWHHLRPLSLPEGELKQD